MDKGVASDEARAGRASPEPASSLGHSATIANADGRVTIKMTPFKLSDEAKRKLAEIDRRQARFWQTARLYMFD